MRRIIRPSEFSSCYQDYLEKAIKVYKQLEVITLNAAKVENEQYWDHFNCHNSQKIIGLTSLTSNSKDLVPIIAFNLERTSKIMRISTILKPAPFLTLEQLIKQQNIFKQEQIQRQIANLVVLVAVEGISIVKKHQEILDQFDSSCFQCCIYEQSENLRIGLGFKNIKLTSIQDQKGSCEQFSQHLQQIIQQRSQKCHQDHISVNSSTFQLIKSNKLLQEIKSKAHCLQIKESEPSQFQLSLYSTIMSNFTAHIFDMIDSTIVGLSQIVLAQYLQHNPYFNQHFICANDPIINKPYEGEIYHNINCQHFEGLSYSTYSSEKRCPICGEMLIFNAERAEQVGRNIFQMLLLRNPINPQSLSLIYHFKHKVFNLQAKSVSQTYLDRFCNFYHFQNYIKRTKNIHNRNEVVNYHKVQCINLYNKLNGKKKFYYPCELISTPVRGKYCHHWQFYDLKRVYSQLSKNKNQCFRCFVCLQQTSPEQIIYLEEMAHLIRLTKQYFPVSAEQKQSRCSINIEHQNKIVSLCYAQASDAKARQLQLDVYETVLDPLSKSRYIRQLWQQQNIKLNFEFCSFFFGK